MNRHQKCVTVLLFGGLGNQLFQYFAGLATASAMNASLCLRPIKQSVLRAVDQSMGMGAIEVEGTIKNSILPTKIQERLLHILLDSREHTDKKQKFIVKKNWIVNDVDLDQLLIEEPRSLTLVGYFQDLKYINFLENREKKIDLFLKNHSPWFLTLANEAIGSRPIIIHIRRGDYVKFQDTIGMLDFNYYLGALSKIPNFVRNKQEVWIFSDSISEAREFLSFAGISAKKARIIEPPVGSSEAESLLLMSYGSALVTSNSTFSWWSAYLSREANPVIVPKKWFKGLNDPINLKQLQWEQMESIWKNEIK